MSGLQVRRLTADDAARLAEMEGRYPESMRQGEPALRTRLETLSRTGLGLSWLCESAEGDCLGYLVAWRGRSMVDVPNPEPVVFIDDLQAADPRALYPLLVHLAEDIEGRALHALPIEGVCRRNAYRLFRDHDSAIARLGYEMHATHEYWDEQLGEELCWMRWRSLRAPSTPEAPADGWVPRIDEGGVSEWDSFNETVESLGISDEDTVTLRHPPPPVQRHASDALAEEADENPAYDEPTEDANPSD